MGKKSLLQAWLAAEFGVAGAEAEFHAQLRGYRRGVRIQPPEVADLLHARIVRHELRRMLQRAIAPARQR